jgi:hypothetical protein
MRAPTASGFFISYQTELVIDGIPALLLLCDPDGAILSELLHDNAAPRNALGAYSGFYVCLLPYLDGLVAGETEQVTHDFGAVFRRINACFGISLTEFNHYYEPTRECFGSMDFCGILSEIVYGFEPAVASTVELRRQLPVLERLPQPPERLRDPSMAQRRDIAQSVYRLVLAAASLAAAPP